MFLIISFSFCMMVSQTALCTIFDQTNARLIFLYFQTVAIVYAKLQYLKNSYEDLVYPPRKTARKS